MASFINDNDNNFINSITRNKDWCSSISCPETYIAEETGFAECNSSPCNVNLDGEDLNTCCTKLCNSDTDCNGNKICINKNNISLCIDGCSNDNECDDELLCLDTNENGIFYCQQDENKFMALLNRIGFIIDRTLYADNIVVDTIILIIFAYLVSKFIDTFNININVT